MFIVAGSAALHGPTPRAVFTVARLLKTFAPVTRIRPHLTAFRTPTTDKSHGWLAITAHRTRNVARVRERAAGLVQGSRFQSADPSVWISSGRIARGPFELGPNAQEVTIWEVDQPSHSGQIPPSVPSS